MNHCGGGAGRVKCVTLRSSPHWLLVPALKFLQTVIFSFGVIKSFVTESGSKNQVLEKTLSPTFHKISIRTPVPRTRTALQEDTHNKLQKAKWHGTPGRRIARLNGCRVAGTSAKRFPMILKVIEKLIKWPLKAAMAGSKNHLV